MNFLARFLKSPAAWGFALAAVLAATVAFQSWRVGNIKEDRDTAITERDNERTAHKDTKDLLQQAATANAKYRETVFTLERANAELAKAKSAVEAQTAAKVKEAEARRRDADRTLQAFMAKFHAAVRDARCGPILATDLRECLK